MLPIRGRAVAGLSAVLVPPAAAHSSCSIPLRKIFVSAAKLGHERPFF